MVGSCGGPSTSSYINVVNEEIKELTSTQIEGLPAIYDSDRMDESLIIKLHSDQDKNGKSAELANWSEYIPGMLRTAISSELLIEISKNNNDMSSTSPESSISPKSKFLQKGTYTLSIKKTHENGHC